jgi:hypothetical protein
MKVFFVSAGEVTTYEIIAADLHVPDTGLLVGLVAAPTRNRATYLFWKEHERDIGDLIEQRWQTKFITDADREEGILSDTDDLWALPNLPQPGEVRA